MKSLKLILSLILMGLFLCASAQDASFYKKYADKGDKEAMYNLAQCYINGTGGVSQDYSMATMWLTKAAKKNYSPAQKDLALCYLYGVGVLKDYQKAWELLNKAQKNGNTSATYYIAQMYKDGIFVPQSKVRYIASLKTAADSGDDDAQFELGHMYLYGDTDYNISQDIQTGVKYLQKSAEQNNAGALLDIGLCYREGVAGIPQNEEKAFEYYYRSAQAGSEKGYIQVCKSYMTGYGTEPNSSEAIRLLNYCIQNNVYEAYTLLGDVYYYGIGIDRDYEQAASNYIKAVENGETTPYSQLAAMYIYGMGVPENESKGFQYYQKAYQNEGAEAAAGLGMCYEFGYGVTKNLNTAIKYYKEAAEVDNNYSKLHLYKIYTADDNGIANNSQLAVQYLREAADDEYTPALFALGLEYYTGDNLHQEPSKAMEYFIKAADAGDAHAAGVVGTIYYTGDSDLNIKKDYNTAFKYLSQALRDPNSVNEGLLAEVYKDLGACYRFGRGTEENQSMASYYTEKANEIAVKLGESDLDDVLKMLRKDN